MLNHELVISQTKKWIVDVVVACNFCPFAAKEVKRGSIHYQVISNAERDVILKALTAAFHQLDSEKEIETTLLILPEGFSDFTDYLDLVADAEDMLAEQGYEGIYQVASFHPEYLFEDSVSLDPANYTNRSPYPMLHILREESVTRAIDSYPDPENIPQRNIDFANQKGLAYMRLLRDACMGNAS